MTLDQVGIDNRKIALIIWIIVFTCTVFMDQNLRKHVKQIIHLLLKPKLLTVFSSAVLYIGLITLLFFKMHLWSFTQLSDLVLWFMGIGVIFIFNLEELAIAKKFKTRLAQIISCTILLDFFTNLYSFNLLIEIVLLPIIMFIVLLGVVANTNEKTKTISIAINWIVAIVGIVFLIHSIFGMVGNFSILELINMLRGILLVPLFTLSFLPFVYIVAVYSAYDTLLTLIKHFYRESPEKIRPAFISILRECKINYWKLNLSHKNFYLQFTQAS